VRKQSSILELLINVRHQSGVYSHRGAGDAGWHGMTGFVIFIATKEWQWQAAVSTVT